jgi:hypothetical protein
MAETYSLEQIRESVLTERTAINGVSPGVRAQNNLILKMLPIAAQLESPGAILGCHLIGSRANGSAVPGSDLDLALFTYDTSRTSILGMTQRLRRALMPMGVTVDGLLAASVARIMASVPASPEDFVYELTADPSRSIGMYEVGVYDTPGLRLGALAANEVVREHGSDAQLIWEGRVRPAHAAAYLGKHSRFCQKVASAKGIEVSDVAAVITEEVWQERTERFGLPRQFAEHYEAGQEWLAAQPDIPQEFTLGVTLYEQVKTLVAQ